MVLLPSHTIAGKIAVFWGGGFPSIAEGAEDGHVAGSVADGVVDEGVFGHACFVVEELSYKLNFDSARAPPQGAADVYPH